MVECQQGYDYKYMLRGGGLLVQWEIGDGGDWAIDLSVMSLGNVRGCGVA